MPVTISNTQTTKPDFGAPQVVTGSENSRKVLHELTTNIQGKSGVIKLMHTTKENKDMVFERKAWYQFGTRSDAKLERTTKYVESLFKEAYQPIIDKIPVEQERIEKQQALDHLINDFQQHAKEKNNKIGNNTMRAFLNRAEATFVDRKEMLWVRNGNNARPTEVAQAPTPRYISPAPEFEVKEFATLEELKQSYNEKGTVERIGQGGMGTVFSITDNQNGQKHCLKLSSDKGLISFREDLRRNDFSAVYLHGDKGRKIPHLARPTKLIIQTKNNETDPGKLLVVSLGNHREAKQYLRELASNNAEVLIAGMEMPHAEGHGIDALKKIMDLGSNNRKHIGRQLFEYLKTANEMGIVDRDFKPENLIYNVNTKELTKIDNGLQVKLSSNPNKQQHHTNRGASGTPTYLAPNKGINGTGPETDLFEAAMTMMEIKYGRSFLDLAMHRFEGSEREAFDQMNYNEKHQILKENGYQKNSDITNAVEVSRFNHKPVSYLRSLCELGKSRSEIHDKAAFYILKDLDDGDPETKFYEKMFENWYDSRKSIDTSQGRKTIFADYYQRLNTLTDDAWLQ